MTQERNTPIFNPEVPADLEHAHQIRGEAFDWLENHYPGVLDFTTGEVLRMVGEQKRRWLIPRLREQVIGNEETISVPAAAGTLAVLFLRSRGVRFGKAVAAVRSANRSEEGTAYTRYGGVWNRLIAVALDRLRRHVPSRLLASAVFSLLRDPKDHPNCLVIIKRHGIGAGAQTPDGSRTVDYEYAYRTVVERPAPSCSVIDPRRQFMVLAPDQLPTRAEVKSRHFSKIQVTTGHQVYEMLLGTMRPASILLDETSLEFVGRILDIVFLDFENFHRTQSAKGYETVMEPEPNSPADLQFWLLTQLLSTMYPGSLSEISEVRESSDMGKILASSVAEPWELSRWDPPKRLEMLSGYASRVGVPLVVERIEHPWTTVIASVEPEVRYLKSQDTGENHSANHSAVALPTFSRSGGAIGALYLLMPEMDRPHLDIEVRVLTVISDVIGETIERSRAAVNSANVSANIASQTIFKQEQFRTALLSLLTQKGHEIRRDQHLEQDVRLPFLLLSAHGPDPDESDPASSDKLKSWLVDTLRHLEWRSFVRSHLPGGDEEYGSDSFIGEFPGVGMMIALGRMVSKAELDRIRSAFPERINRISPVNAPVKFLAWVLDVPAQRILDAADDNGLPGMADDVERWAFDVATVVDDVAQSEILAHKQGDWDAARRRVRKALQKEGARTNSYLRRIAADCSFSLGDWPSALKYAQEAVKLSKRELGSGSVRSMCLVGDALLCLCDPVRALDVYSEAATQAPTHPLPRYHRGQALLLMARLIDVYESEQPRSAAKSAKDSERVQKVLKMLVSDAMDDLTVAEDFFHWWGPVPESYVHRNFHLIPTLMGQGLSYLLDRSPGPAASRLQSARRSFPQDDLFFREFLFAKCWEQGLHRRYSALLLGDEGKPVLDRLNAALAG